MSLRNHRTSDTELDHIRDTLTGMVTYASNTRGEMLRRFDHQDKEIAALKSDVTVLKKDVTVLKEDVGEIKGTLKIILSRLPG
ncbi:hypothetical protein [Endozoicomonas sp. ALD040]|uniref:hypothetical protein n=1 Tax=Endozoicomonas sp. ALD040 TaxID=3403079 RepID=UPI003BB15F46